MDFTRGWLCGWCTPIVWYHSKTPSCCSSMTGAMLLIACYDEGMVGMVPYHTIMLQPMHARLPTGDSPFLVGVVFHTIPYQYHSGMVLVR